MAYISSIQLPNGSTYDIKDGVARDKARDKPDFDNFPTNPFSADVNKKLYINKIDNAFYCADKRWTTLITLYDSSNAISSTTQGTQLFDGNYESTVNVPLGGKAIILMTFDPTFPGYPYGHMFLSFYYNNFPSNVTGRVYCNYQAHGIGWHDITWSKTSYGSLDGNNWTGYNGLYQISQIEITVQGGNTTKTKISQLEMHLDRPHPSRNPFVSKYSAETLYYPLTAPSFIGNVTGNLTGSASLTGTPTAPTASAGTNNTQIATTAFVNKAVPTKTSDLTNDSGFLTSESDPIFSASAAHGITSANITSWNNKGTYSKPSGGIPKTDLASAVQTSLGKADTALQSYTETDPVFSASVAAGISSSDISNWNGKANTVDLLKVSAVTVATSGWTAGTMTSASGIAYTYYKEVSVTGMTTNDFVDISNVGSASSYKNNYAVESLSGKFRIWVASQPTVKTTWRVYYKVGMTV